MRRARRAARLGLPLVAMLSAVATAGCNLIFGVEEGRPRDPAAGGTGGTAPEGRALYVSAAELEAARAAAGDGREPWAAAYARFQDDLPLARVLSPISVVDNGGGFDEDDDNRFATNSATTNCDTVDVLDPRHDYCGALAMGRTVRDLAFAYVMDGDGADADRAIDLLHHWFVDPATRMDPSVVNFGPITMDGNGGSTIEIHLAVPLLLYGASLLEGHPSWDRYEGGAASLRQWVDAFVVAGEGSPVGSNSGARYGYFLAARAAGHAYLGQPEALLRDYADWRDFVDASIAADGTISGANDAQAAWFLLKSIVWTAQLSTYQEGDNLYEYGGDPPLIQRALETYGLCVTDAPNCTLGTEPSDGELAEGTALYELGYSVYQTPLFLQVVESRGRPVEDLRLFGWSTLTHANRFELDL